MLNIKDCALVIIDIQDRLVLASKYGPSAAEKMAKIAKAADILSIPTIVTEQYPKGLGNTVPTLKENLSQTAYTIEKSAFSALLEDEFKIKLKSLKIMV